MNNIKTTIINNIKSIILIVIAIILFSIASKQEFESDKQNDEDMQEFIDNQLYQNYNYYDF